MIATQSAIDTFRYRVCGLDLSTPFELSCASPLSSESCEDPDVSITPGAVPESLTDADYRGPNWETTSSEILLRLPFLGRFLIREGSQITYQLGNGASEAALPIFFTGSALGAVLHQRGEYVLHASAIAVDGGAMIFCGQSGSGKSSLVATLCAAGYPLISDDVCRIHFGSRTPTVIPDGRNLKLWQDTITRLGLEPFRRSQIRPGIEKYWVEPPSSPETSALPVRAIYLLASAGAFSLNRLPLVNAVESLRAFAYRPRLVKALNQEALWLNRSAVLAAQTPVCRFERQWSLDQLDNGIAQLQDHWSRL